MNKSPITAIKYHLHDYKRTILGMYLVVYLIYFLMFISDHFWSTFIHVAQKGTIGGLELVSAITIFIIGLNSFKDNFKFFSANGLSRKTQLYSTAVSLGILSITFAFIDTINCLIFKNLVNAYPLYMQIYAQRYGYVATGDRVPFSITPQILAENFLWLIFLYFFVTMIGLFITILYYRMNKKAKIAVSIVIPTVFLGGILQEIDSLFLQGRIHAFLLRAASAAWGIAEGYNPYIAMASMFVFAAFFGALSFLLARRAIVKK